MPTLVQITGTLTRQDGSPWGHGRVTVTRVPIDWTADAVFPDDRRTWRADGDGVVSFSLWANEEGDQSSTYAIQVAGESGQQPTTYVVTVPEGVASLTLQELLELGVTEDTESYQTVVAWLLGRWRGDWEADPADPYEQGQQVQHQGSAWIALIAGPTTEPGDDPAEWGRVSGAEPDAPEDWGGLE